MWKLWPQRRDWLSSSPILIQLLIPCRALEKWGPPRVPWRRRLSAFCWQCRGTCTSSLGEDDEVELLRVLPCWLQGTSGPQIPLSVLELKLYLRNSARDLSSAALLSSSGQMIWSLTSVFSAILNKLIL